MTECLNKDCKSKNIKTLTHFGFFDVFVCQDCEYWTYRRAEICCRNPNGIITILHKNTGQYFLYEQCLNCGGKPNKKALSAKKFAEQIRSEFSEKRYEEYFEEINRERKILEEDKKYYNLNYSKYGKYLNYLQSKKWRNKRELALKRDNYSCQKCKEKPAEQVHHLTYDNLENEKLEDLISVCRECHEKIHSEEETV